MCSSFDNMDAIRCALPSMAVFICQSRVAMWERAPAFAAAGLVGQAAMVIGHRYPPAMLPVAP